MKYIKKPINYEIDLGVEKRFSDFSIKSKVFYSKSKDYIYNKNGTGFENIDTKIYRTEVSGYYFVSDKLTLDYGLSYTKGKKDEALDGQSEIPLLKANFSLIYDFGQSSLNTQLIAAKG